MISTVTVGWVALPLVSRWLVVLIAGLYVVKFALPEAPDYFCIQPSKVVLQSQLHRLFLHAFWHRDVFHAILNVSCFWFIAKGLERGLGSVRLAYLVLLLSFLTGLFYTVATALATFLLGISASFWNVCAVGFSGVVLALMVIHVYNFSTQTMMTIRGHEVPVTVFPVAALLASQLLPRVAFWSHFCGLFMGYFYVASWLDRLTLSPDSIRILEESSFVRWLAQSQAFVFAPDLRSGDDTEDALGSSPTIPSSNSSNKLSHSMPAQHGAALQEVRVTSSNTIESSTETSDGRATHTRQFSHDARSSPETE